ncbi:hypothetical protein [Deinococcus kurensis]|uniref:hypothetical protein n=1 Tax=Deinococcus kurensis TaxID=2662757 RepID=UPI0012D366D7|nr:hypothetical protein [Deinococcus kurensis]
MTLSPTTPAPLALPAPLSRAEAWAAYCAAAERQSATLAALLALHEDILAPMSPERQAWLDASAQASAAFEAWAALATDTTLNWEDC